MMIPSNNAHTNFTALTANVKKDLDSRFKAIRSSDEAEALIDEFLRAPDDGRGDIEREIAGLLSDCDARTGYAKDHGTDPICSANDRKDPAKVNTAAQKYREYACRLYGKDEIDALFFEQFYEIYKASRSSEDYMKRLVKRRMSALNGWLYNSGDSLRLQILKQYVLKVGFVPGKDGVNNPLKGDSKELFSEGFIEEIVNCINKNGAVKTADTVTPEDLMLLDDSIFDLVKDTLEAKTGDDRKAYRKSLFPVFFADDIATAKFDNQLAIRRKLYIFAFVFEMVYYLSTAADEAYIPEIDFEKNLFYDYYADNLLTSMANDGREGVGAEPSGHGINYKNFAEIIYLYYLHRTDLSPREKLNKAEKMIDKCKTTKPEEVARQQAAHAGKDTQDYLMAGLIAKVMDGSEDELREFVLRNYVLGTSTNTSAIRTSEENIAAGEIYELMVDIFDGALRIDADAFLVEDDAVYRRVYESYLTETYCKGCKTPVVPEGEAHPKFPNCPCYNEDNCIGHALDHFSTPTGNRELTRKYNEKRRQIVRARSLPILKGLSEIITENAMIPGTDMAKDEGFQKILRYISKRLAVEGTGGSVKDIIKREFPAGKVSRTKLIILYYFIFILQYSAETGLDERYAAGSFTEFWDEFCENFELEIHLDQPFYGLNQLLCEAEYQMIDPKNLFDMFIVFHAYKFYRLEDDTIRNEII